MKSMWWRSASMIWAMSLCAGQLTAQSGPVDELDNASDERGCCSSTTVPVMDALRVGSDEIEIDGLMSEGVWARAPIATDFVQMQPDEGKPATERTEAWIVYDESALYVAIRAHESEPSEIRGQLTRRDDSNELLSDQLAVGIDSYFDKRTAFLFMVNPVGVQTDIYMFDDVQQDIGWDAVWDVATSRDEEGWTAEFRIPFSQLRFNKAESQTWGINFVRGIARKGEMNMWAPASMREMALVSRFGELRGLRGIRTPGRVELLSYSMARLRRAPGDEANPFYRRNDVFGTVGADLKYGITSDLTLDVTINPDFGQIEADPGVMNLTALESFFPEKRPFFTEGSSIFRFPIVPGDGGGLNESIFYSRRIGRAPQGSANPSVGYIDASDRATILGAGKLSGKTENGWSVGVLNAITSSEYAQVAPRAGVPYEEAIEPLTNYGVLRVQKDFRGGRSAFGMIGTSVNRSGSIADQLALRSAAYTGGIDLRHRFNDDVWELGGYLLGSYVQGSEMAIARTQASSARYYQRPDAEHVIYDPTRRSLAGSSADFHIMKIGGGYWKGGTGFFARTPGFEINDLGFQGSADQAVHWGFLGYQHSAPQGPFRMWMINTSMNQAWNFEGKRLGMDGNVSMMFQTNNLWMLNLGISQSGTALSPRMLRGGPLFKRETRTDYMVGVSTDQRKKVQFSINARGNSRAASDSWALGVSPSITLRPSESGSIAIGASVNHNVDDSQWVTRLDTNQRHYLFGRIDQMTVGLTARAEYSFTPTLSIQVYAQPFVSAGQYSDFKRVSDPLADSYADRLELLSVTSDGGRYYSDVDGNGTLESFRNPDFNFKQFKSNLVLRWEYLPGSRLFLVWSQGRNHFAGDGTFDYVGDIREMFSGASDNVFMVKLSYWLGR
mgnify:FL=1